MKKLILVMLLMMLVGCSNFNLEERQFKWIFGQTLENKQCS